MYGTYCFYIQRSQKEKAMVYKFIKYSKTNKEITRKKSYEKSMNITKNKYEYNEKKYE